MKSYTHESPKLNALIGGCVKITFYDGDIVTGKLSRGGVWDGEKKKYRIDGIRTRGGSPITMVFRKSHIKKIEVMGG